MKKKIVAILLCVLIVCAIGVSLVACNNDGEQVDPIVGMWVGYRKGDDSIQFFMHCYEFETTMAGASNSQFYINAYKAKMYDNQIIFNTTNSPARLTSEANKYTTYLDLENFTFENSTENNTSCTVSFIDGKLVVQGSHYTTIFKKVNLTVDEWKAIAFQHNADGEGYTPYFYEQ